MTEPKNVSPAEQAAEALGITQLVPTIYRDLLQPAAREAGQQLVVVARAVAIALAPLKAAVWDTIEYLEFIARYILRYGISPAESDIGRHFLLSAPSVNRMVQTLERRGFITRKRGAPRSIAIVNRLHRLVPSDHVPTAGNLRPNKPCGLKL